MNKKFLFFTGINFIDKFLLYLLPLIPLYIFKDHQYYNLVEFVYSLSLFFPFLPMAELRIFIYQILGITKMTIYFLAL